VNAPESNDKNPSAFHRVHAIAAPLFLVGPDGTVDSAGGAKVSVRLSTPDHRAHTSLAIFFQPGPGLPEDTSAADYSGYLAAGTQGLYVLAYESAEEQGGFLPVERVYGGPEAPIPLAGGVFGWQVSAQPDAKEWRAYLSAGAPLPGAGIVGRWLARATLTANVEMSDLEWQRIVRRLYLTGPSVPRKILSSRST
jgi:hypothetical protein